MMYIPGNILSSVRQNKPLIHCITNYVTVNDCANVILACGASPVMADELQEVQDITNISQALLLNIGTLNQNTVSSMKAAGKKANEKNIPVIFDPVGAGASEYRKQTAQELLSEIHFSIIRGNISEILCISEGICKTRGVDASYDDLSCEITAKKTLSLILKFAKEMDTVVAVSGKTDVIASSSGEIILMKNGDPIMTRITGSGCMLGALCAAFAGSAYLTGQTYFQSAADAAAVMAISGEQAAARSRKNNTGTGTLHSDIIDGIDKMTQEIIQKEIRYELY